MRPIGRATGIVRIVTLQQPGRMRVRQGNRPLPLSEDVTMITIVVRFRRADRDIRITLMFSIL